MSITHAIWRSASGKLAGKSVNLSKVSKILNVRVATLWTYHHGRARWSADLWLKCLLLVGAAKIEGDALILTLSEDVLDELKAIEPTPDAYRNKFSPGKVERMTAAC